MRQAEQFAQLATKALSDYNGASLEAAALKYCQSLGFAGFKFCLLWSEGAQRFSLNLAAQGGMTASIGFGQIIEHGAADKIVSAIFERVEPLSL